MLAGPGTRRRLARVDDGLRCKTSKQTYPLVDGIPWLFAAPSAALAEWRRRFGRETQGLDAQVAKTIAEIQGNPSLRESTRQRLALTAAGYAARAKALRALLAPLGEGGDAIAQEALLALRTRLPPTQGLTTYEANIFRDWCWGDEENALSAEIVSARLPASYDAMLVLGAGAGRLAYDLHQGGSHAHTVALDINPLLAMIGRRVCAGETLSLRELPLAPRRMADVAIERTLAAPAAARPGLEFVLGDIVAMPLSRGAFDVVVAPWFVDIVETDFEQLARQMSELLKPDGRLVLFGSLSFRAADPAARYSFEEVLAVLQEAGLDEPEVEERRIPYLNSPGSRHGRVEEVVALGVSKRRDVKPISKPAALPEWLVAGREPVPLTEAFQQQITATRIHTFIMSLIDGKRSIRDMAAAIEAQQLMPRKDAEEAVRRFLETMWDESRRSDF